MSRPTPPSSDLKPRAPHYRLRILHSPDSTSGGGLQEFRPSAIALRSRNGETLVPPQVGFLQRLCTPQRVELVTSSQHHSPRMTLFAAKVSHPHIRAGWAGGWRFWMALEGFIQRTV